MKSLPKNKVQLGNWEHFNDKNDHNPMVLPECSVCKGYGKLDEPSGKGDVLALIECPECKGRGFNVGGNLEPYFSVGHTPVEVFPNTAGWIKCPLCGISFKEFDKNVFSGLRHKCGQKLVIKRPY